MKVGHSILVSILLLVSSPARADEAVIPAIPEGVREPLPVCRLTRSQTDFVLSIGEREIKRFAYTYGANFVEPRPVHDRALLTALETLEALKRSGACR